MPYVFVMEPVLLFQGDQNPLMFIPVFITALLGMAVLSAAVAGFYFRKLASWESVILALAGLLLVYPVIAMSLVGLVVAVIMAVYQRAGERKKAHGASTGAGV